VRGIVLSAVERCAHKENGEYSVMQRKPRIRIISKAQMRKNTGGAMSQGGESIGNTIFITKDAGNFVIEHEKAHIKLKHTPARLTAEQLIKRELKADVLAVKNTGMKRYPKYYLNSVVNDISGRFGTPKKEVKPIVIREAKKLKLI